MYKGSVSSPSTYKSRAAAVAIAEKAMAQPKPTVLCVDDQADTLALLRIFLSTEEVEVITASSAMEALRCIEQRLPDLVITDYVMPGMTGLDLCRALRGRAETHHIPIILHTGSDVTSEDGRFYDRLIPKPAGLDEYARALRAMLPRLEAPARPS